ncbi:MAG TPA: hypothetical protein VEV39_14065 [Gemmatimonadales bacterium]|nr:hypothetical protein [Gemmatimonadales bacterium]
MRRFPRVSFAALAAVVLAGVTCSFPTDQSDQVFVTVTLSAPLVVQGASITAHGHAFRKSGSGNVPVNDVDFQWSVSDSNVARIVNDGRGTATITGVNAGLVHVVARAAVYDKAADMDSTIRVARALEIDSIKPDSIVYGARITVYGVGINNIFLAELGNAVLDADTFSFQGNRNGIGHMQFWVPFPAHSDQMIAFGPGVFATATESTFVNGDHDIYAPNDTNPARINLDSAGPIAQLPLLRFFNPALFFRPFDQKVTSFGFDWFRFEQSDTTLPVTFVLVAPGAGRDTTHLNILTDSIYYSGFYSLGASAWILAPQLGIFGCRDNSFFVPIATEDSTVVELGNLTGHAFQLFDEYTQSGPYGMRVTRGLIKADPGVGRDRFSPNEVCNQADANFAKPALRIAVNLGSLPFVDTTLTIDFPHATDWYRFHLDSVSVADSTDTVSVQTVSRSPGTVDTSDIDITVLDMNGNQLGQAADSGSTEQLKVLLHTGQDYYVVVSDFAGAPVRYGLCIQVASNCATLPPPIPAPPGMTSSVRHRALAERQRPSVLATARLRAMRAAQAARIPFRLP